MDDEALKYSYDLFVKDGYKDSFEDYKKLISTNKDALKYSYDLFVKDGYKDNINDYSALLGIGGVEPPKKKDTTASPSTSGGGKQGYLSNALSSQFGTIPTGDEQPVLPQKELAKKTTAKFGQVPMGDEQKSPVAATVIPDVTKDKKIQSTLNSYDAVKDVTAQYDDAKSELDEFLQNGVVGNSRLVGFDPSTGQIIPDSPADKYKRQLEDKVASVKANADSVIKDFQKNVPSAKNVALATGKPKQMQGMTVENFVPTQEVQALDFVRNLNDTEKQYAEMGIDINKALNDAMDIGSGVFLNNDQRLLYDAVKSGDEAKYKEAKDYIYREQQNRINEIDKLLITGGANPDLLAEKRRLQGEMADFLDPNKALAEASAISPKLSAASQLLKDMPAQDRLKLIYLNTFKESNDLAMKLTGQPLFIQDRGHTVINPLVDQALAPTELRGKSKDGEKLRENIGVLKIITPAALANQQPVKDTGNLFESFGKSFVNNLGANVPLQTEKGGLVYDVLQKAVISPLELTKGAANKLEKVATPSLGEEVGNILGFTAAVVPELLVGQGELALGKELFSLAGKSSRIARAVGNVLDLANDSSRLGRALKIGLEGKLAGMTFGDKQDELGILNLGAESVTSEVIEDVLGKTKAGKYFAKVFTKMFGENSGKALQTIGRMNAFGLAETGGETAGTLVQLFNDSNTGKEFMDKVKQQFGEPSEALKFFLETYLLGSVFGGVKSPASEAIDKQAKDAYSALEPQDKLAADKIIAQEKDSLDTQVKSAIDETVKDVPDETVTKRSEDFVKAKEELDKVKEGEPYKVEIGDAVFEGNSAEELRADKDYAEHIANTYTDEQTKREATKDEAATVQQPAGEESGVGVAAETVAAEPSVEGVIKETPQNLNQGEAVVKETGQAEQPVAEETAQVTESAEEKQVPVKQIIENSALKDVESTAKALESVPPDTLSNYGIGGDLTKFRNELSKSDQAEYDEYVDLRHKSVAYNPNDLYKPYKYDKKRLKELYDKFEPLKKEYFEKNKVTPQRLAEQYHFEAKNNPKNSDWKEAIEALVNKQTGFTSAKAEQTVGEAAPINPNLFSNNSTTREKAIREEQLSPEQKAKVRRVNEVLTKENVNALAQAIEDSPEAFAKKYGLVKIC